MIGFKLYLASLDKAIGLTIKIHDDLTLVAVRGTLKTGKSYRAH